MPLPPDFSLFGKSLRPYKGGEQKTLDPRLQMSGIVNVQSFVDRMRICPQEGRADTQVRPY